MSEWGPWCQKCGHTAGYHGMTFCLLEAGAPSRKQCDCDGYQPNPSVTPIACGEAPEYELKDTKGDGLLTFEPKVPEEWLKAREDSYRNMGLEP